MNIVVFVVPIKSEATAISSFPISDYVLVFIECCDEMICMFFFELFDAKIINADTEFCGWFFVFLDTRGV